MADTACMLLAEIVLPEGPEPSMGKLADWEMLVAEFDTTAVHRRQSSPPVELGALKTDAPDGDQRRELSMGATSGGGAVTGHQARSRDSELRTGVAPGGACSRKRTSKCRVG